MGMPQDAGFYPPVPDGTLVPTRGFGIEAGGHVYLRQVGPARLGAGAGLLYVRGTSGALTAMSVLILAPQVSFNFGTEDGWSYLSGGAGVAQVRGRYMAVAGSGVTSLGSGGILAVNVGGGARWFFRPRIAFAFDVRLHRLTAQAPESGSPGTPVGFLGLASAGLSFR
jgi:hypothetical protein